MFNWNAFPFVRYTIVFSVGILLEPIDLEIGWQYLLALSILFYLLTRVLSKSRLFQGVFGLLSFLFFGAWWMTNYNPESDCKHLSHLEFGGVSYLSGKLIESPEKKGNFNRAILALDSVVFKEKPIAATGRVFVYFKNEIEIVPEYGDRLFIRGGIQDIPKTNNPFVFDYKTFLKHKKIYGMCFVDSSDYRLIRSDDQSLLSVASEFRKNGIGLLHQAIKDPGAREILRALVFGDKSQIDDSLRSAYSGVGVIHVLAVSGLHVGIIYWILNLVVSMITRIPGGNWMGGILIISGLWFYAFVTGLSPSVMRASTMFSIIAIQGFIGREGNIYNSLGISAFLLLMVNPYLLYDLGFQLSYLAVFGIVYLHPKIYGLLEFRNWFFDKVWSLLVVSLAAQITTLPLTLFYFHTFPTYFLLANLVVIPVISLILICSFPMLILFSIFPDVGAIPAWGIETTLRFLNHFILWMDKLPFRSIENISLEPAQVWMMYAFLIMLCSAYHFRSFMASVSCILSFCAFFLFATYRNLKQLKRESVVVYQSDKGMFIDFIDGKEAFLISASDSRKLAEIEYQINPYRLRSGLPTIESLDEVIFFSDNSWKVNIHWKKYRFTIVKFFPETEVLTDKSEILFVIKDIGMSDESLHNFSFNHLIIEEDSISPDMGQLKAYLDIEGIMVHSVSLNGFWEFPLNKLAANDGIRSGRY